MHITLVDEKEDEEITDLSIKQGQREFIIDNINRSTQKMKISVRNSTDYIVVETTDSRKGDRQRLQQFQIEIRHHLCR